MEYASNAYVILEASSSQELMVKVNAMLAGGWFLVGGVAHSNYGYAQAMGYRGTPPDIVGF